MLLVIVQSPFIFSYSCEDINMKLKDACLEISESNLNYSEKELLISNLEYKNNIEPNHFLIYTKNMNLKIKDAPYGVQVHNDRYIKNGWMKIFALMPSVFYRDSLYTPKNTKIFTGFHYEFDEPKNYRSPRYPKTKNGDCKIRYKLLEKIEENKIYVNGVYQGQGKLVSIVINKDSKIESVYSVRIKYDVNHYEWDRYCCRRRNGRCVRHCHDCDYDYDQIKTGRIEIKDTIYIKIYKNNLSAEVLRIVNNGHSSRLKLNYSDSIEISFINSEYNYHKYLFGINNSFPPYNILILNARDYGEEILTNIFKEEDSIIVNDAKRCTIKGFDFFNEIKNECSVKNSFVGLRISTDKLRYNNKEEIVVKIFPENISAYLTYGNKPYLVKNEKVLNAIKPYNKITVVYYGELAERIIYIKDKSRLALIYNLFLVILVFVVLYIITKKYWRQIWQNVGY